ncbi:MAG TPA: hypothetical protein VEW26_15980 [Allosphingosinicella sp.]|nr:hypothetical protein [Allosphingosinicella sp.]
MIRKASSERRGRGPERRTTGVPAPIVSLAARLLLLSRWSRETGFDLVVATGSATKEASLRDCRAEPVEEEG